MQDWLGPGTQVGFCGNLRPMRSWADGLELLGPFTAEVRRTLRISEPVGVGLWLPAELVRPHDADQDAQALRRAAAAAAQSSAARVFTFNGFPYGDFQAERVKHDVYSPDWTTAERARYTADLLAAAAEFAPQAAEFSISTLPIGWRAATSSAALAQAGAALRQLADALRVHHERTGQLLHVDLEPEPGCVLERSADVIRFFETHLLPGSDEATVRKYLRVCHDVCHAAVLHEPQEHAFRQYAAAGIEVGKVQISSALRVDFDALPPAERAGVAEELRTFGEQRFLHQTHVRTGLRANAAAEFDDLPEARPREAGTEACPTPRQAGTEACPTPGLAGTEACPTSMEAGTEACSTLAAAFFDDLPQALDAAGGAFRGEWRVHFHVPIHLARVGRLGTTQGEIAAALRAARRYSRCRHFEVETYAWSVLPGAEAGVALAAGVAQELEWLRRLARELESGDAGPANEPAPH